MMKMEDGVMSCMHDMRHDTIKKREKKKNRIEVVVPVPRPAMSVLSWGFYSTGPRHIRCNLSCQ